MLLKPHARQLRYVLEGARFFEQMSSAGDDLQPSFCPHACPCFFVHADDYIIVAANDKKSRRGHQGERIASRSGRPPRETMAAMSCFPAAAMSAAAAPVDAPK